MLNDKTASKNLQGTMKVCNLKVTLLGLVLWYAELARGQLGQLTCKICERATSLDECTGSVRCAVNEACYMDEIITEQLTIVYTGGCRAKVVCDAALTGLPGIGKRSLSKRSDLIACSRCCTAIKKSGELDCNARLCGIKYLNTNASRCYLCDSSRGDAEQADVHKPEDCLSETTCQPNEACGARRQVVGTKETFTYTCMPKLICSLLTHEALKRKEECLTNPDPHLCGDSRNVTTGKRAATEVCTACCGDGLCNSGSCQDIIDRLFNLWQGKALDFDTLKKLTNVPLPTKPPTTATSTVPSTTQSTPATKPPTIATSTVPSTTPTKPPTTATSTVPSTTTTTQKAPTKPTTVLSPSLPPVSTTSIAAPTQVQLQTMTSAGATSPPVQTSAAATPAPVQTSTAATPAPVQTSTAATPAPVQTSTAATSAPAQTSATATPAPFQTSTAATPAPAQTSAATTPAPVQTSTAATPAPVQTSTAATAAPVQTSTAATSAPAQTSTAATPAPANPATQTTSTSAVTPVVANVIVSQSSVAPSSPVVNNTPSTMKTPSPADTSTVVG